MSAMLTHALYIVGKSIIGGEAHAEVEPASMKLLARSDVELDIAVGSVVLACIGFLLIFALGLPSQSIWHSKLGADAGWCVFAVGITGFLLHYARARVLSRRADRRTDPASLKQTFWTSSSDMDLVFQLAVGIVVSCRLTQQSPQ